MLKNIYQIGKNVDWESDLLKKIRPYIELTKEQLTTKSKPAVQPTRREEEG